MVQLCGAVEAGGTKFVCAVGTGPDDLRAEARFATTTPEATLTEVVRFLDAQRAKHGDLAAIGAGCFGPLDLDPASKTFGHITSTPKQGWAGTDLGGVLGAALGVPVVVDTDVNAAAFGEWQWGAARGLDTFVYLTVGTGIGGGIMQQEGLFPLVRERLVQLLNGYIHSPQILEKIDAFVVPPALGARAGILGAIALARGLAERVGP